MNSAFMFDIDGTLLNVDKNFMRPFISEVLQSLTIDPAVVNHIRYSGRTDSAIFRDLLGEDSGNDDLFRKLKHQYITQLEDQLLPEHVTVFEGAVHSVEYLLETGAPVGLLTGNFEESAFIKLKAAGLDHYFSFGAFGCRHVNRNLLPGEAEKAFIKMSGRRIDKKYFIIIGDTPSDIRCAKYFGATSVAVATGNYTSDELVSHKPNLLLESLNFPEKWTSQLQL